MKIKATVDGKTKDLHVIDLHGKSDNEWAICHPEKSPDHRIIIPVNDIIENKKTYFGFDGSIEFVLPHGVPLKVGDNAKVTFNWPNRNKVSKVFHDIDTYEDVVSHINIQGPCQRYFHDMRDFEKEYKMIKLEVDGKVVYDITHLPFSL